MTYTQQQTLDDQPDGGTPYVLDLAKGGSYIQATVYARERLEELKTFLDGTPYGGAVDEVERSFEDRINPIKEIAEIYHTTGTK